MKYKITLNGKTYEVEVEEGQAMLVDILKVSCSQGQAVKAGDILVVLEAMKMENEILAPRDGTVAQVVTTKGAVVDTGAPLVVLA